ncbi:UPF0175 family protein [Hahella sp. KA22]|uniref:UPF0175 family protein n=1 Tax=Hahella sp. KA22 TaxID=1628392 RepID=UPI000FDD5AD0|nr:UPF0175 family protein [Hahella sp. KA22]AZZ92556.1 UPF0175 family protein [Hahella sp. KA22]QAY55929.1 UPF0175 family protein [Hahella sp. KA22]
MKIEIDDEIAQKLQLTEKEALELLAIALYKDRGIHGAFAGKIAGISEFEFHGLLAKKGFSVNYDVSDFLEDIERNDL